MSFGHHLRTLRTTAGLSRAEAGRRARVPVSTLRGWENDRGFPQLAALLRLAEVLRVPVERIAEGVEDPAEDEPEPAPEKPPRRSRTLRRPRGQSS
jgi:transcriptional regulator with XRE-family HTH domain